MYLISLAYLLDKISKVKTVPQLFIQLVFTSWYHTRRHSSVCNRSDRNSCVKNDKRELQTLCCLTSVHQCVKCMCCVRLLVSLSYIKRHQYDLNPHLPNNWHSWPFSDWQCKQVVWTSLFFHSSLDYVCHLMLSPYSDVSYVSPVARTSSLSSNLQVFLCRNNPKYICLLTHLTTSY